MDAAIIESEALKLSEAERAILVDHLQSSLNYSKIDFEQEHLHESRERFDAYSAGKIDSIDGPTFVSALRSRIKS